MRLNAAVTQRCKTKEISERDLRHWELVQGFCEVFEQVAGSSELPPTLSDRRRKHHFGSYLGLFLLGLVNPVVHTMRGLCGASHLKAVQDLVGGPAMKLATFSEMQSVLDPELLHQVFVEVARRSTSAGTVPDPRLARLDLVAQDGSLWRALPRMSWARYGVGPDGNAKGVRLHLRFHLVKAMPCEARVAEGQSCEREALRQMVRAGQINVGDRLYGKSYQLLRQVDQAGAFFVFRLHDDCVINEQEALPITSAEAAVGVVRHAWATLGFYEDKRSIRLRLVEIRTQTHRLLLATNLPIQEASAELIGLIYRRRWQIELFFRWIKCILGHRHLFAESPAGVAIQMYLALIASLLLQLYTGKRPNKRQFEAIQFFLLGWATQEELAMLIKQAEPKKR